SPDLRRDEVDDPYTTFPQLSRETQVEVGVVDQDRGVRRIAVDLVEEAAEDTPQGGEVRDDFDEPDHGEVPHVRHQGRPLGAREIAAEAEELDVARPGTQAADQLRRVEVAGGFAAGDEQAAHEGRAV